MRLNNIHFFTTMVCKVTVVTPEYLLSGPNAQQKQYKVFTVSTVCRRASSPILTNKTRDLGTILRFILQMDKQETEFIHLAARPLPKAHTSRIKQS